MDLEIKRSLFAKMLRLSTRAMENKRVGELISRLEGDASAVGQLFVNTLMSVIISLMTVLISGFYVLRISPQMTAIAFGAFLAATLSFSFFGKLLAACQRQMRQRSDIYMSRLQESFAALTEIRTLGAGNWFQRSIGDEMHRLFDLRMRAGNIGMWSGLTSSAVSMAAELSITAVACWLIMQGRITVGTYVSFGMLPASIQRGLRCT